MASITPEKQLVFIGTYTQNEGDDGIFLYTFDSASGALSPLNKASGVKNPSFLTVSADRRFLYSVSEISEYGGGEGGAAAAFALSPDTGALSLLNMQPTHGLHSCYVSLTPDGRYACVANYSSGNATLFPIGSDGGLLAHTALVQHAGHGPNADRQEGPHAHCAIPDPTTGDIYVCDLGIDRVMVYGVDGDGKLVARGTPLEAAPGAGPRHVAFSPNGTRLYVVNELDSTVSVYERPTGNSEFNPQSVQTVSTLPPDYAGAADNTCADIHVHPSGRFLYASNRGHDSLALFSVDSNGRLTAQGHVSTQGKTPRNFALDLTGAFLLAANQNSDNVVVYSIDPENGGLTPTGQSISLSKPVCIKMIEA